MCTFDDGAAVMGAKNECIAIEHKWWRVLVSTRSLQSISWRTFGAYCYPVVSNANQVCVHMISGVNIRGVSLASRCRSAGMGMGHSQAG